MSPTKNHILIGLSESERTKFVKEDFASQSAPQKVFSALWEIESEVNNGGFSQYFVGHLTGASAPFRRADDEPSYYPIPENYW